MAGRTNVIADDELDRFFPDHYASVVQVRTRSGNTLQRRNDIARGYPESPLGSDELDAKFRALAGSVAGALRVEALSRCLDTLDTAANVSELAALLSARPDAAVGPA